MVISPVSVTKYLKMSPFTKSWLSNPCSCVMFDEVFSAIDGFVVRLFALPVSSHNIKKKKKNGTKFHLSSQAKSVHQNCPNASFYTFIITMKCVDLLILLF